MKPPIKPKDAFRVASEYLRSYGKEAEHLVRQFVEAQGAMPHSTPEAEEAMFRELVGMIRDRTGVKEIVVAAPGEGIPDPLGKAKASLPGRPALYLE